MVNLVSARFFLTDKQGSGKVLHTLECCRNCFFQNSPPPQKSNGPPLSNYHHALRSWLGIVLSQVNLFLALAVLTYPETRILETLKQ